MKITVNKQKYRFNEGQTILEIAKNNGIYIPTLCWTAKTGPASRCRICVVEIDLMPGLQPACSILATDGMVVVTDSDDVLQARRTIVETLLSNGKHDCISCDATGRCELQDVAYYLGIKEYPIFSEPVIPIDTTSPMIVMDPNKCILCGRCIKGCNNIVINEVLTLANRGYASQVVCDNHRSMGDSGCVQCGECLQLCPTGALTEKKALGKGREWELERVNTTCAYCGVGCQLTLHIDRKNNRIIRVSGRDEVPNRGMLCVKGRFGYEFPHSKKRISHPLIRKGGDLVAVSWDEALDYTAKKLLDIKQKHGADAISSIACARTTTENNYALMKFTRVVLGTNNIDHCART